MSAVAVGGVWRACAAGVFFVAFATAAAARAQSEPAAETDLLDYATAPVNDPVARLQKSLQSGRAKLEFNDRSGYLESLLRQLKIPVSSQSLVFSKTSFQHDRISPSNPRAIYFDDDTYVGWVRGGEVLEVATTDPNLGPIFYTLDQRRPDVNAGASSHPPAFVRQTHACLQCHGGPMTHDTPGLLVRSVFPDARGQAVLSAGTFLTTQKSPWSQRWGGWYVTGTHGSMRHMGNSVVTDESKPEQTLDRSTAANVTDLAGRFDTGAYLSKGSDLVGLLVLEHQAETHNLIARANHQARLALRDEDAMNRALGRPGGEHSDSTRARIEAPAEALVRQMLFVDEPLLTDPIAGTSEFAEQFEARGPHDAMGRSLRDLDLKRRLFRYPLSYLIYSEAFDTLPAEVKDFVYRRLWQVLNQDDADAGEFSHLKRSQRRAIREILAETKPDLPPYWKRGG